MTPANLAEALLTAAHAALAARGLDAGSLLCPVVTRPRQPEHGDYASPFALHLAKSVGASPLELAGELAGQLRGVAGISAVEVIPPGFINVRLSATAVGELAKQVVQISRGYREFQLPTDAEAELTGLLGRDAARYVLASHHPRHAPLVLDVERWSRHREDNPVYTVQYSAARAASVARNAAELGVDRGELQPELLADQRELLLQLGEFPGIVDEAARRDEPHRVARYLERLAEAYQKFHATGRILPRGDEESTPAHRARLWLNDAARTVFANGLGMLGVTAPAQI